MKCRGCGAGGTRAAAVARGYTNIRAKNEHARNERIEIAGKAGLRRELPPGTAPAHARSPAAGAALGGVSPVSAPGTASWRITPRGRRRLDHTLFEIEILVERVIPLTSLSHTYFTVPG